MFVYSTGNLLCRWSDRGDKEAGKVAGLASLRPEFFERCIDKIKIPFVAATNE